MRLLITCLLIVVALLGEPATAADKPPQISSMRISPDGRHVVALAHKGWSSSLVLTDLDDHSMRALPRSSRFSWRASIIDVNWIDNELLAVDLDEPSSYAVNLKGEVVAKLGEQFLKLLPAGAGDAKRALVYRDLDDREIDIVDLRSQQHTRLSADVPGRVLFNAFDRQGVLRAVTTLDSSRLRGTSKFCNWYRAGASAPWQLLAEFDVDEDPWKPLAVLDEPGMIAVLSRHGRDNLAVFRYDTVRREHVDVMAGHPTDDVLRVDGLLDANFQRVVTGGIKPTIHWFDPQWAALQQSVDAALPGAINTLSGNPKGRVLIYSESDVDPGRWFVVDTRTSKFWEVGVVLPNIDPKEMRPKELMQYAARDGLEVQGYLTRPADQQRPAPMVVLIHGGPQQRDSWEWERETQWLAAEGFVVFQPQFRGSTGFGARFERAGYMQWGRAMQDDISDGVAHLVAQGIVDPKRVCIYGASYGGYAALWGAIKTPELYRCAASFMGVTDLFEQAHGSLLDDSTVVSREFLRARLGDPEKNRAQLDEVSPLRHADRVGVPVFIAHGLRDRRVLPSHSRLMVDALRARGKPVEWLPLDNLGHWEPRGETLTTYNAALLKFLRLHLGAREEPVAAPAAEAASAAQTAQTASR